MWPIPWPDEAHFADIARTLLHEGRMATDLFGAAVPGMQDHAFWTPPLYYLLLAAWFVVHESLWWQRALSLLCGLLALGAVWRLTSRASSRGPAVSAVLFLCVDVAFVRSALVGRMDMLCVALGLWSVVLARESRRYVVEPVTPWQDVVFGSSIGGRFEAAIFVGNRHGLTLAAGLLAGLAVCTHPMGIAAAAGCLLWAPRWRTLVGATAPVVAWLGTVWSIDSGAFLAQWGLQIGRKSGDAYEIGAVATRFVSQYQPNEVAFAVLLAGGVVAAWMWDRRWLLLLLGTLALALRGGEMWYPVYLSALCIVPLAVVGIGRRHAYVQGMLVMFGAFSVTGLIEQVETAPEVPVAFYASLGADRVEVRQLPTWKNGGLNITVPYRWVPNVLPDPYWFVSDTLALRYPAPWEGQ